MRFHPTDCYTHTALRHGRNDRQSRYIFLDNLQEGTGHPGFFVRLRGNTQQIPGAVGALTKRLGRLLAVQIIYNLPPFGRDIAHIGSTVLRFKQYDQYLLQNRHGLPNDWLHGCGRRKRNRGQSHQTGQFKQVCLVLLSCLKDADIHRLTASARVECHQGVNDRRQGRSIRVGAGTGVCPPAGDWLGRIARPLHALRATKIRIENIVVGRFTAFRLP